MKKSYLFLVVVCLFVSFVLNTCEDTLVHHYDISIFAELGHGSYWYPDWTRKYENIETLERKGWWIFDYPAWFYDGWHLTKIFRYLFYFYSLWFIFIYNQKEVNLWKLHWKLLGSYILFWALTHWIFYDNLLIK
jgi:hypothetical protein